MIKVECRRCGKELEVPGALAFGVPDTDGSVNKHHICIFCWDQLLCWLYNDGEVVPHSLVSLDRDPLTGAEFIDAIHEAAPDAFSDLDEPLPGDTVK